MTDQLGDPADGGRMSGRTDRTGADPDLGVLAGQLLFAVQQELYDRLTEQGFADLGYRHGAVLAHLDPDGARATDLARRSGQHKQVIGTLVDELEALGYVERRPDPADRRAKLVVPTERGRARIEAADAIMADIQERHARRLGPADFTRFRAVFADVIAHQRKVSEKD
jgi:DNA-binding MarR family transcriptional regulator